MDKMLLAIFVVGVILVPSFVLAGTPSPDGAKVYIISPSAGEVVQNPVTVQFGLQGMGVAPAGVDKANTGHHHLLIDTVVPPLDKKPIPSDATHKHFGKGQTETNLTLSAGKHTLQLILGDKGHIPFSPPVISDTITITVK